MPADWLPAPKPRRAPGGHQTGPAHGWLWSPVRADCELSLPGRVRRLVIQTSGAPPDSAAGRRLSDFARPVGIPAPAAPSRATVVQGLDALALLRKPRVRQPPCKRSAL